MKKQILLITGLLGLVTSAFAAQPIPTLPLNALAKDIKEISNKSIVVKTTDAFPDASEFIKQVDQYFENKIFKNLTKPELLNIQAASIALHNAYKNASEKLEKSLESTVIPEKTVDNLINVLVKLYKGESYSDAIKGLPFGFTEGPAGIVLALVTNAANLVQNLHAHFEEIKVLPEIVVPVNVQHGGIITSTSKTLLPAIKITKGTFTAQNEKAKHFIAYAIGRLVIYKTEIMKTLPVGPEND